MLDRIEEEVAAAAEASRVAVPSFSPSAGTYSSPQSVTIACATPGARIRYSTDGDDPTPATGTLYSGPVLVAETTTLKAVAYLSGRLDSPVASAVFTITGQVAMPVLDPAGGAYDEGPEVTISTATAEASIRYTLDGSTPTSSYGSVYAAPVHLASSAPLKAVAYLAGWADSEVVTATYTVTGTVGAPTFSPGGGTYPAAVSVSISSATAGAAIRYTVDGSEPRADYGNLYTGTAIFVPSAMTLMAIAYRSGLRDSMVSEASYTFGPPATPAGLAVVGQSLTTLSLSWSASGGATSYYLYRDIAADGSFGMRADTGTSTNFVDTALPNMTTYYYKVRAVGAYGSSSLSDYVSGMTTGTVAQPVLSPGTGTYVAIPSVTMSCDTPEATIRYTTDDSTPTASHGEVYNSPIPVTASDTLKAIAYKADWLDSALVSATYTCVPPAVPTGLQVTAVGDTSVSLSWSASTGATSYQVVRDTSPSGAYATVAFDGTAVSAADSTAASGTTYFYKVRSAGVFGWSALSTYVSGTTTSPGAVWAQQAYLKAPNAGAGDYFGISVAVSGDTAVVGAHAEASGQRTITNGSSASSDDSAPYAGAAYLFVRTAGIWSQQAYLKAPNADESDQFGRSVGVSGDTVVVGAPWEDSTQTTVTNGDTASWDNSGMKNGAAYVFVRSGGTWTQRAYLKAPNGDADDNLGYSVAVSGDTVVVGAWCEDSNQTVVTNGSAASADNSASYAGAVYVFVWSGTAWSQQAYLKPPNATSGYYFGEAIAVSWDTIVVGSQMESSGQTTITNGSTAPTDYARPGSGAAYVFVRSGVEWAQQAFLKAPNAGSTDHFGWSVAASADTVVVGAYNEDSAQTAIWNGSTADSNDSAADAGAAYVFVRSAGLWSQQAYLKAPNAEAGDWFGHSVAVSGDTVVVGANREDSAQVTITNGTTASSDNDATDSGSAYVFFRSGATWSHEAYLKAPNAEAGDKFGHSVAVSGDTVVVGANQEGSAQTNITNGTTASADNAAANAGAVYVFYRY